MARHRLRWLWWCWKWYSRDHSRTWSPCTWKYRACFDGCIQVNTRLDEDIFRLRLQRTFSRRFQDVLKRRFQDIFKTSSIVFQKCPQDIFKMFWGRPQDLFKMYHQVKLFLLTRFQDVFQTYWKHFWHVLQRRLSIEGFA